MRSASPCARTADGSTWTGPGSGSTSNRRFRCSSRCGSPWTRARHGPRSRTSRTERTAGTSGPPATSPRGAGAAERAGRAADVYVSSGTGGHAAAKTGAEAFGGQVRASPKIHGRKDGRDLYRVTYHVRIPGFRRGDLLRFQGRLYRVKEGVREGDAGVEAIDLEAWTSTRIRTRDLKRAAPLPGRIERFRVLETTGSEVVVERDGERVVVPRPASWVPAPAGPGIAVEAGVRLVPGVCAS